ncbi:hypothetical protein M2302_004879 [Micromonospora sp. A200]|nr:hypothetical protein [Micromonospora sp. A200]
MVARVLPKRLARFNPVVINRVTGPHEVLVAPEAGRHSPAQDSVRAHPREDLHGQITQEERQPGRVVADVSHHQDVRITRLPLPGRSAAPRGSAVPGGDCRGVITRRQPHRAVGSRTVRAGQGRARETPAAAIHGAPDVDHVCVRRVVAVALQVDDRGCLHDRILRRWTAPVQGERQNRKRKLPKSGRRHAPPTFGRWWSVSRNPTPRTASMVTPVPSSLSLRRSRFTRDCTSALRCSASSRQTDRCSSA